MVNRYYSLFNVTNLASILSRPERSEGRMEDSGDTPKILGWFAPFDTPFQGYSGCSLRNSCNLMTLTHHAARLIRRSNTPE